MVGEGGGFPELLCQRRHYGNCYRPRNRWTYWHKTRKNIHEGDGGNKKRKKSSRCDNTANNWTRQNDIDSGRLSAVGGVMETGECKHAKVSYRSAGDSSQSEWQREEKAMQEPVKMDEAAFPL